MRENNFTHFFVLSAMAATNVTLPSSALVPIVPVTQSIGTFHAALEVLQRQKIGTSVEIKKLFHGRSLFPPASPRFCFAFFSA